MCSALGHKHVDKGTRWGSAFCYIRHIPCPNCGEPKPLKCFWDTLLAELLVFLLVFCGGMMAFICFTILAGLSSLSLNPDQSLPLRIMAAAFMILYIGAIFLINRWRAKGIPDIKTGYMLTIGIFAILGAVSYL